MCTASGLRSSVPLQRQQLLALQQLLAPMLGIVVVSIADASAGLAHHFAALAAV